MPNWTFNTVEICGEAERIKEIKALFNGGNFDFNKVIPMPESLSIESGSMQDFAILTFLADGKEIDSVFEDEEKRAFLYRYANNAFSSDWPREIASRFETRNFSEDEKKALFKNGEIYVNNIKTYGCPTWYEWCNRFWGTKWNACGPAGIKVDEEEKLSYYFNTAWAEPEPVIIELHEMFPDVTITHSFRYEEYCDRLFSVIYEPYESDED